MDELIISIFYELDNFSKQLHTFLEQYFLPSEKETICLEPPYV